MKEVITVILIAMLIVGLFAGCATAAEIFSCDAKTRQIGYHAKYVLVAGCLIEVENGRWIPLDSYYWEGQK